MSATQLSTGTPTSEVRRGRVIQYNVNEGRGTLVVDGTQHPFTISEWRGAEAPQLNRIVDAELNNGVLVSVTPVAESVLLNEKAGELKAKMSSVIGSQLGTDGAAIGKSVTEKLGKSILIGYGVFILATVFFKFISVQFLAPQGMSLLKGTSMIDTAMGSSYHLGLYLAYLSVLVPLFWKSSRAWLATAIPLLVLVLFFWAVHRYTHNAMDSANSAASFLGGSSAIREMQAAAQEQISKMISIGMGAYLSIASALYLAYLGVRKYLAHA